MESLYTKYRPQTFDDVVGQTHVVTTLERAVLEGRTSHAYLFCGPRGTGKTTMARLLAKALMCEQGEGHLPDGTCDQCRSIAAGEHPDVYELDAASRTGVDNVREEIISRVSFAPAQAAYKMYIIDEVHMLTTAAFNALLKTLEEPPSHVVFVLCTTDPQKIPETILSRVQRFDFHSISNADIQKRLAYICEREGFTYDEEALELVVRHARGGMRDAISELEQLSVSGGGAITVDVARDVLGEVSASTLERMSLAMANRDVPTLFAQVESLVEVGRDLLQFTRALAGRLRDVYVVAAVGASSDAVNASDDELPAISREAKAFGSVDRIARALGLLSDASTEMRVAPNQRLVLEVALTKIARPQSELTLEALADRVAQLERQIVALSVPAARQAPSAPAAAEPANQAQQQAAPARAAATHERAAAPTAAQQGSAQPTERQVAAAPQVPQAPFGQRMQEQAAPSAAHGWPQSQPQAQPQGRPQSQVQPQAQPQGRPQVQPQPQSQAQPRPAQPAWSQPDPTSQAAGRPAATNNPEPQRPAPAPQARAAVSSPAPAQPAASGTAFASKPAAITDPGELQRRWKQVVDDLLRTHPQHGSLLMQSTIASDDGETLLVTLPKGSGFACKMLDRQDVRTNVDPAVDAVFGRRKARFVDGANAATVLAQQPTPKAAPAAQPAKAQQPPVQQPAAAQQAPAAVRPAAQQAPVAAQATAQQAPAPAPAWGAQERTATPSPFQAASAAPSRQPQVAPTPQQVAPSKPQAPVVPFAPAQAPQDQASPSHTAPWEASPASYDDDVVPYDDFDTSPYEEEYAFDPQLAAQQAAPAAVAQTRPSQPTAGFGGMARQQVPARPVEVTPAPAQPRSGQGAPVYSAPWEPEPAAQPAAAPRPAPQPVAAPEPKPAPQPVAAPQPAPWEPAPAPTPAPQPAADPKPAAQPVAAPQPTPAPPAPASSPAPQETADTTPAAAQESKPQAQPDKDAAPAESKAPKAKHAPQEVPGVPNDIVNLMRKVFGEGVVYTSLPPEDEQDEEVLPDDAGDDQQSEYVDEPTDDADYDEDE